MSETGSRRHTALGRFTRSAYAHVAALVLLGLIAYSNSFDAPFYFDDLAFLENPQVRSLGNIPDIFLKPSGKFSSRPLMHATIAVNYAMGGADAAGTHMDTTGFHIVNVGLHLLNGVLLYLLVIMTSRLLAVEVLRARYAALLIASVFVLHPVQTEAVTYLVSRSMLLATTFYLLGLILFIKAVASGGRRWPYIAALFVASVMGMASREDFATFPLMLVVFDLFFVSRFRLRDVLGHYKAYIPVFLSLGYLAFLVMTNTYDRGPEFRGAGMPHREYFFTEFSVHWTYLRLLVFPFNLNLDYDYPAVKSLLGFPAVLPVLGYAALWLAAGVFANRRPVGAFGVLWFLVILLPISFVVTFMDMRIDDVIFEHRFYLPSVGLIAAMGALLISLTGRLSRRKLKKAATVMLVIVPLALATATYARNGVWSSHVRMWEDVVEKSPLKARPHNNLGNAYQIKGLTDRAVAQFERAIELDPFYADPHLNLGSIYYGRGMYREAEEHFKYSVYAKPTLAEAHLHYALSLFRRGKSRQAERELKIAASLKPYPDAHYNLGVIYIERGERDKARAQFMKVLALNPSHLNSRIYLNYMDGKGNPPPH